MRRSLLVATLSIASIVSLDLSLMHGKAQGLIGGLIDRVLPGAGTALDDLHRQIKEAIPPYKMIEEGGSKVVNETIVQATAPLLEQAIMASRDDALRNGVQPVPIAIRENLEGFISPDVLNAASYRVRGGGDLSLQVNSIRYGEAYAITLERVIVFANAEDAQFNPTLWAHELTHVQQYRSWGLRNFAISYVRNYQSVEREAYEAETRYVAWTASQNANSMSSTGGNPLGRPIVNFSQPPSNTCGTAYTACVLNGKAPVGTPCWCATPLGPATGSLIPTAAYEVPRGLPTGTVMLGCGCWGYPTPSVPEPRCASGLVRPVSCNNFCPAGGYTYSWVCG